VRIHPDPSRPDRRAFLRGAAAGGGLAVASPFLLAACSDDDTAASAAGGHVARYHPFEGTHQTGITVQPVPTLSLAAAFDVKAPHRDGLVEMLRDLTDEARGLMAGRPPATRDPAYPPTDSGILGAQPRPDDLTVVVAAGASLFDERYGLAERRPRELVPMPFLANDRLDPERTHGDLLVVLSAGHADTLQFALRQLMRRTRRHLVLRWLLDGYARGSHDVEPETAPTPRNLLGFKDGTANLDSTDAALMDRYVWVGPRGGEPDWAVGGSYLAFRTIRMLVEFWDRTPLAEQESIIGRHKLSGAPLGTDAELAAVDYGSDPDGLVIPLDAHIRLANPRTAATESSLILRRGFSFTRGFDAAGRLDQGLAFVAFQRSLADGFLAVQRRLDGEPLEEYIRPVGGGFFFAFPGVESDDGHLGQALVT
jgi:deferrochelatase/peroxidase EfeB